MCTQAQLIANRINAQKSTGPRTEEGKARSAQNATTHGLTAAIPPEQNKPISALPTANCQPQTSSPLATNNWQLATNSAFDTFYEEITNDLNPKTALERTIAHRIIHLMWRLRRIPDAESELLNKANSEHRAAIEETNVTTLHQYKRRSYAYRKSNPPPSPQLIEDRTQPQLLADIAWPDDHRSKALDRIHRYEASLDRSLHRALKELHQLQKSRQESPPPATYEPPTAKQQNEANSPPDPRIPASSLTNVSSA